MTKSESIKELAEALTKFQWKMTSVKETATNPFFKNTYASLEDIINASRAGLAENGLSFAQFPSGQNSLSTILMHASGQWIEDTFTMTPVDNKPQSLGSALTYARRYALAAVLGIATTDDDGNAASTPKQPATTRVAATKPSTISSDIHDWIPPETAPGYNQNTYDLSETFAPATVSDNPPLAAAKTCPIHGDPLVPGKFGPFCGNKGYKSQFGKYCKGK